MPFFILVKAGGGRTYRFPSLPCLPLCSSTLYRNPDIIPVAARVQDMDLASHCIFICSFRRVFHIKINIFDASFSAHLAFRIPTLFFGGWLSDSHTQYLPFLSALPKNPPFSRASTVFQASRSIILNKWISFPSPAPSININLGVHYKNYQKYVRNKHFIIGFWFLNMLRKQ